MKILYSITAAAALSCAAHAEIVRNVEKTFSIKPGAPAEILSLKGDITVVNGTDRVAHIVAHEVIRADTDAQADKLLDNLDLKMGRKDGEVFASATYGKTTGFRWSQCPVRVDFVVTVPRGTSLSLKTTGGSVKIGELEGNVTARTSGGNVILGRIAGAVDLRTSGGHVSVGAVAGGFHANTGGGGVTYTTGKVASVPSSASACGTSLQKTAS